MDIFPWSSFYPSYRLLYMSHIVLAWCVILCVIVPGPPVGILFPEVRTNSVRLIWQPPAQPNGIILGECTIYKMSSMILDIIMTHCIFLLCWSKEKDISQFDFVLQPHCSLCTSFCWSLCLLSLSDHIQKKLFKQQRRHRRRAEPQRATVHSDWTETRNGLCIPPHCSNTKGLGGGCWSFGGHNWKKR